MMRHFELSEFLVSESAARRGIDMTPTPIIKANLDALVKNILDPLRDILGKPVCVTSGYRPVALNKLIGGAATSQHCLGQAADVHVIGMTPRQLCEAIIAAKLPFDQLIQEFDSWAHVSYSNKHRRQVLTARRMKYETKYLEGLQ